MSTLRNPKHEKFAQLVASGMTARAAFTQAGYPSPQNAPRLRNNALVAKRIEELQARKERRAEMAALSRDELIEILTEIVHAARNRLLETRTADGLKAAEMLAKMCGWNEPQRVNVQSVEVKVDAAVIEQLRAGYAEMNAHDNRGAKLIAASLVANAAATPVSSPLPVPGRRKLATPFICEVSSSFQVAQSLGFKRWYAQATDRQSLA